MMVMGLATLVITGVTVKQFNGSKTQYLQPAKQAQSTNEGKYEMKRQQKIRPTSVKNQKPGNDDYAERELVALTKFFNSQNIGFRVKPKPTRTPRSIVYQLQKANRASVSSLRSVLPNLETAIYQLRSRAGSNKTINVLFDSQALTLSIPRIDPQPILFSNQTWIPAKWHTHFAKYYVGGTPVNVEIDLDSPNGFSVLVGAVSGAGKSALLDSLIINACRGSHPDELKLILIDVGNKHFGEFANLPHTHALATTEQEAMDVLTDVYESMTGPENQYQTRYLIVVDEIQRLTKGASKPNNDEFKRLLYNISSMGRAYGYSFVYCTQSPAHDVIPANIRDNCAVRVAGRCTRDGQSASILGDGNKAAVDIENFSWIVKTDGSEVLAYSYLIKDLDAELEAIRQMYPDYEPDRWEPDSVQSEPHREPVRAFEQPKVLHIPQGVIDVFERYSEGNGTFKRGMITNAVKAYAEHIGQSSDGNNFNKFKAVVEQMKNSWLKDNSLTY